MTQGLITEQYLKDIGDAIREKNGSNEVYYPSEMASAILSIPTGSEGVEPTTSLVLTSNKVKTTGDVTLTATLSTYRDYDVLEENGYLEGATVTFYKMLGATPNPATDTSLSTSITNNVGVATSEVTITENSNLYARFDGISSIPNVNSNVVNVTVESYLFYDDCTTDKSSLYHNNSIDGGTISLTYSTDHYSLNCSPNFKRAVLGFNNIEVIEGIKIEADIQISNSWASNGMIGFFKDQSNYTGGFAQGEKYYRLMEIVNGNEVSTSNTKWNDLTLNNYDHHELIYNEGILTYTITNANGMSKTLTLTERISWIGSKVGLFIETNNQTTYIKNIKVEAL